MLAFSDALFAIAMTLLVVGLEVPDLSDTNDVGDLADALNDDLGSFISFLISFAVIGRYWVAHHSFCSRLAAIDGGLIGLNLVYLLFIAFLPFPTGLFGNYFENPLAFVIYTAHDGGGQRHGGGALPPCDSATTCLRGVCPRPSTGGASGNRSRR